MFLAAAPRRLALGLLLLGSACSFTTRNGEAPSRSAPPAKSEPEPAASYQPRQPSSKRIPIGPADAVWGFLVQREVIGLRDRAQVIAQYGIPREVLARIGAR
jgi:hypothetical protein